MIHVIRKMIKVSISFRVLSFFDIIFFFYFFYYYLSYHLTNLFRIFSRQFPQMSHDLELQTSWTISNLLRTLLCENQIYIRRGIIGLKFYRKFYIRQSIIIF